RDLHPARAELAAVIQKFDRVFESNLGVPVARRLPMNVVGVAADTQTLAARILHANQRGGDTEERHCSPQCSQHSPARHLFVFIGVHSGLRIQMRSHGLRAGRPRSFEASGSPMISSFPASQWTFRPVRKAMLPRCATMEERCPVSTSATGLFRVRTHSMKFFTCNPVASSADISFRSMRWPSDFSS